MPEDAFGGSYSAVTLTSGPYPNVQRATGSLLLNDGDHITDSGGDQRITFTDAGSTLFKNAGGTTGISLSATNNTTFTGMITANGGLTLGAGDDLIGSATSDININSVFTVAGASGNTVVAGTLSQTGKVTLEDGSKLNSTGTTTSRVDSTNGTETSTIDATSTDVAGRITFSSTWANADTCTVTFAAAYDTAPKVILGYNASVNAGITAVTTDGFVITATGTCVGFVDYLVVESV